MTAGARDRLARLLELVPYLVAHPGARVEDVAAEFGIPEHTLLDDLQLLFVCGLPGHMPDDLIEASFEDGVIHVANADTIARPLRLGADEALALIVGLRTLAEVPGLLPGGAGRDAVDRALAKLERAAGDAAEAAGAVAVAVEDEQDVVPRVREAPAGTPSAGRWPSSSGPPATPRRRPARWRWPSRTSRTWCRWSARRSRAAAPCT